jgi:hypothetical protein
MSVGENTVDEVAYGHLSKIVEGATTLNKTTISITIIKKSRLALQYLAQRH